MTELLTRFATEDPRGGVIWSGLETALVRPVRTEFRLDFGAEVPSETPSGTPNQVQLRSGRNPVPADFCGHSPLSLGVAMRDVQKLHNDCVLRSVFRGGMWSRIEGTLPPSPTRI